MRGAEVSLSSIEFAMKVTVPTIAIVLLSAPAFAGGPLEAVKPFYDRIGLELDPAERSRFVDPAKAILDARDRLEKSGQGECLDANMPLDNADYDKAELDSGLKLSDAEDGDNAIVVASFIASGTPHRMQWKLTKIDGQWKIADLLSVTNEWALSQYQCE